MGRSQRPVVDAGAHDDGLAGHRLVGRHPMGPGTATSSADHATEHLAVTEHVDEHRTQRSQHAQQRTVSR